MANIFGYLAGGMAQGFGRGRMEDIKQQREDVHAELERTFKRELVGVEHENRLTEATHTSGLTGARETELANLQSGLRKGEATHTSGLQATRDKTLSDYKKDEQKQQHGFRIGEIGATKSAEIAAYIEKKNLDANKIKFWQTDENGNVVLFREDGSFERTPIKGPQKPDITVVPPGSGVWRNGELVTTVPKQASMADAKSLIDILSEKFGSDMDEVEKHLAAQAAAGNETAKKALEILQVPPQKPSMPAQPSSAPSTKPTAAPPARAAAAQAAPPPTPPAPPPLPKAAPSSIAGQLTSKYGTLGGDALPVQPSRFNDPVPDGFTALPDDPNTAVDDTSGAVIKRTRDGWGIAPPAAASPASEDATMPIATLPDTLAAARDAIRKGVPRAVIEKRLRERGIDPAGL